MAINAFHYSIRKQRNRSNHQTLQPTKTNSRPSGLGGGEWKGVESRDISLPRFVSAREAGRGEVFQLNADYIALSRYWKYIDNQAGSPSCLLGLAPSTSSHIIVRARVESFSGRDHRNFGQQRLGDISMYHGLTERNGQRGGITLARLFFSSLARFLFDCLNRLPLPGAAWPVFDSKRRMGMLGEEEVAAGRRTRKISSRPALSYTPYRRKCDICGRPGMKRPAAD